MKRSNRLFRHSIRIIRTNQAESGAYIACPNFPVYRYCWFRDGALIAYAMDQVGQHESVRRFHGWAARTILSHADKAQRAIEKAARSEPLGDDYLHARYTLDGNEGPADWPNFQLDGLGTWLWTLKEHIQRTATSPTPEWEAAAALVARYLAALWRHPCYDLWEERPQYLHPYTLAAIYAGLRAAELLAIDGRPMTAEGRSVSDIADQVRSFVLTHGVQNGHLVKHIVPPGSGGTEESENQEEPTLAPLHPGSPAQIDAGLLGVAIPHRLLAPDDPIMHATVARIEADLHCSGGGVHRYQADTYYGGGEWVVLAAWLGWYYTELGEWERARELFRWVETQADADGYLPEQTSAHLLAPDLYPEWQARWGPVAKPLLWSHAMYLVLYRALETAGRL